MLFPLGSDQASAVSYQRALATAVAVQQHMIAHPVQAMPYGRFPFTVKLGLGDGWVDWGILVPEQTGQTRQPAADYVSGVAVEAAAGAEHYARSGNIILSPGVRHSLGDLVKTLPTGDEGYTLSWPKNVILSGIC